MCENEEKQSKSFRENWGQNFWGRGTFAISPTCGTPARNLNNALYRPPWAVKKRVESLWISTSGFEILTLEMWQI